MEARAFKAVNYSCKDGRCVCEQNEKSHSGSKVKGLQRHRHAHTDIGPKRRINTAESGCDPVQ